jgi:hypothetical protein
MSTQTSRARFFAAVGPRDVVTSCGYYPGEWAIRVDFKTRAGSLVGYTLAPLPAVSPDDHQYFLTRGPDPVL